MKCTIELAPDGGLRLTTPNGRTLDFVSTSVIGLQLMERILAHWEANGDDALPNQSTLNGLTKVAQKRRDENIGQYLGIDWSRREPAVVRKVVGDALSVPRRKPKKSAKRFRKGRGPDIDLSKVTITL